MDPTDRAIKGFYCIFKAEMVEVVGTLPHETQVFSGPT